jgi:multidrug resistance efflux pump
LVQAELEQVQAELEQVQAELEQVQAELEQVQVQAQEELVQAELVQAPAQFHDQTISDAPLLREIYGVGQKQAWNLAAPLRAPAA